MKIEHETERTAIIRMVVTIHRIWAAAYYPHMKIADAMGLDNIYLHIYLAHVDGRPITISKLSRALGRSRATILRRLDKLIALGFVERKGERLYYLGPAGVAPPNADRVNARIIAIVKLTAKELSKLNGRY